MPVVDSTISPAISTLRTLAIRLCRSHGRQLSSGPDPGSRDTIRTRCVIEPVTVQKLHVRAQTSSRTPENVAGQAVMIEV